MSPMKRFCFIVIIILISDVSEGTRSDHFDLNDLLEVSNIRSTPSNMISMTETNRPEYFDFDDHLNIQPTSFSMINMIETTYPKEFAPYQVFIIAEYAHLCGGAIYSGKTIITSAHCLSEYRDILIENSGENIFVETGYTKKLGNTMMIDIKYISIHPDYDNDLQNNIGMIYLENELEFNDYVGSIDLPEYNDVVLPNTEATWIDIFSNKRVIKTSLDCPCEDIDNNDHRGTILCASTTYAENSFDRYSPQTLCYAGEGCPLVIRNKLIGIFVGGQNCSHECSHLTKFTKLSSYVNWIKDTAYEWNTLEMNISDINVSGINISESEINTPQINRSEIYVTIAYIYLCIAITALVICMVFLFGVTVVLSIRKRLMSPEKPVLPAAV